MENNKIISFEKNECVPKVNYGYDFKDDNEKNAYIALIEQFLESDYEVYDLYKSGLSPELLSNILTSVFNYDEYDFELNGTDLFIIFMTEDYDCKKLMIYSDLLTFHLELQKTEEEN